MLFQSKSRATTITQQNPFCPQIPSKPSYFMIISLVPSEEIVNGKQMSFQPLQLLTACNNEEHPSATTKKEPAKRKRTATSFEDEGDFQGSTFSMHSSPGQAKKLTMKPQDWRVLLEKKGREIYICNPSGANAYQARSVKQELVKDALSTDSTTGETVLHLHKLRLTVIKPLQQQSKANDGIHITNVLEDIFVKEGEILAAQGWTRDEAEKAILKEKKVLLDKVRIRIQTLTENPLDGSLKKEGEDVSGVVNNKKGRKSNQLQIWMEKTKMPLHGVCSKLDINT